MKTYYEEVKEWLEGPDDGRIPSEALAGVIIEHAQALGALKRLSTCEAFGPPRAIDPIRDEETLLRIEFARKHYLELTSQRDPEPL